MRRIWKFLSSFSVLLILGLGFVPQFVEAATDPIGSWSIDTQLPYKLANLFSFSTSTGISVVTGSALTYNSHDDIVYSVPNSSGVLSSWQYSPNKYPKKIIWGTGAKGNYYYGLGGYEEYSSSSHFSNNLVYYSSDTLYWSPTTILPQRLSKGAAAIVGNYIYYSGGWTDSESAGSASKKVYFAPINADGSLGSWGTTTDLPDVLWDHGMVSYGDYIYVMGGKNSGSEISQVIRAKANADGTLGTWTTMPSLPGTTRAGGYTIVDNYIFVVGGYNGSWLNTVYYTSIDSNGQMANWSTSANALPVNHASGSLVANNGYLYLIGGWISGYGYSEKVYKTKLNIGPIAFTPVIFLPGMGGSWNYEAMVHNSTVSDTDWKLTPFVTVYDGLISTLKNSGFTEGTNFWVYYYDWRKNIADTASNLSNFINSKSLTKVSLIGHSQGGLVARAYAQSNPSKIEKLITIASPHAGALSAYRIWGGADFSELPAWQNLLIKLYLKINRGSYNNDVATIQNKFPNLRNILPSFEYFTSGVSPKSNYLDTLTNNSLYTISGTNIDTPRNYTISTRNSFDALLGRWIDGKPINTQNTSGDGTVLATSSQISGEIENLSESGQDHQQIVSNTTTLAKVQSILGVTGTIATSSQANLDGAVLTTIASAADFSIKKPDETIVYPQDNLILTLNPSNNYQVLVTPQGGGGSYTIYSSSFWDPITGNIYSGTNTHNLVTIPPITSALTHITNVYNTLTNIIQKQDALRIKSYINDFNSTSANTQSGFDTRSTRLFSAIDLLINKAKNTTVTENLRLIKADIEQLRINRFGN